VTGRYEPVADPEVLVDTIRFEEDTKTDPVGTIDDKVSVRKNSYNLAVLMPFDLRGIVPSIESLNPNQRRFVHYYSGVKMAVKDLGNRGIKLNTEVFDCKESVETTKQILATIKDPDAIIGPYEMSSIKATAAYGLKSRIPVFSPWTPSIPTEADNPYFVQLNPGLEVHARAIVNYIDNRLPHAKVYLVSRQDPRERSRLNLYRDARQKSPGTQIYEDLIIEDASAELAQTHLDSLLSELMPTVFVLPYYSRSDEDFISSFLRKLHAEQGKSEVYVFGLPQWLTFNRIGADYLESTNVHVSTAFYMNSQDPVVRVFQQQFLRQYGTVPEQSAYQGYAFTIFLGESLNQYGTGFLDDVAPMQVADHGYLIAPVYRTMISEKNNPVNYYENQGIQILRFKDHTFRLAE
jgi:ABC-type branched-subunit amino acid transport system substrate-binding protein